MGKQNFTTPMMQQYIKIKEDHPDALLFFRLGDFYELFLDDAKIGADLLDITLTKRPRGKDGYIPMAGVPYHVADTYISRLVKKGRKVAICEQVSEPNGKGIVEREVVRVVTPGTLLDEKNLDKKKHNYTISITTSSNILALAVCDLSTGDFQTTEVPFSDNLETILDTELARFDPTECVLSDTHYNDHVFLKLISKKKDMSIFPYYRWHEQAKNGKKLLQKHFGVSSLKGFGISKNEFSIQAAAALLGYLQETQKDDIDHVRSLKTYTPHESVVLDKSTIKNLELFQTIHDGEKEHTFYSLIDETKTAMGGRKLREWITKPLLDRDEIEKRHEVVKTLLEKEREREEIKESLKGVFDIERTFSRLSVGIGTPVDLIHLSESLVNILEIKGMLTQLPSELLKTLKTEISPKLQELIKLIDQTIVDDPPFDPKNGGLIRDGVNNKLDSEKEKIAKSKKWLSELEENERKKTGIGSLKVGFNKVAGYYIEISKTYSDNIPKHYIRRQTLVNAERYITSELKKHEDKVLAAEEKIQNLEYEEFLSLIEKSKSYSTHIQNAAQAIASIDCLTTYATTAQKWRFTKPTINEEGVLEITEGRHPVVESILGTEFVPNDTKINTTTHQLTVITGPNMAGKSVYMRQVALITLMAHCGMYVPASHATIPIIDRLFVRSGASDAITEGLSTFMLEMVEAAHILTHATKKSLIVMDEVGRGTSTYDGISIAWSIASYLVQKVGAKTLFATHYHELAELEKKYPQKVKNGSLAIEDRKGKPIFLYTFIHQPASSSYGIAVADLAGVPHEVVEGAYKKLSSLDIKENENPESITINSDISNHLGKLDLDKVTPIEALNILTKIKKQG